MTQPQPAARSTSAVPAPLRTWRGLATNARQHAAITVASWAAGISFLFLLISSGWMLSQQASATVPGESALRWATWQYQLVAGGVEFGYPPLLVGGLLFAAAMLFDLNRALTAPLAKARGHKIIASRWSAPAERRQARAELRAAGYSGLVGASARVRLMIGGVLALLAGAYSLVSPLQEGFTRGYGPTVCAVGGLVAVLAVLVATPWAHWPHVVLLGDGRLTLDGTEPLADVVPFPAPAPPPPAAAPPYPQAAGNPYPPPPPRAGPPPPPPNPPSGGEAF